MKSNDKTVGFLLLVAGVCLVTFTPVIAVKTGIFNASTTLFLREAGMMISALSAGVVLTFRSEKYRSPWILAISIVFFGIYLASSTIGCK